MKFRVKEEEFIAGEEDRDLAKPAFNKAKAKVKRNLIIFTVLFIALGGHSFTRYACGPYYSAGYAPNSYLWSPWCCEERIRKAIA